MKDEEENLFLAKISSVPSSSIDKFEVRSE